MYLELVLMTASFTKGFVSSVNAVSYSITSCAHWQAAAITTHKLTYEKKIIYK